MMEKYFAETGNPIFFRRLYVMKILKKYLNTWDEICFDENARLRTNSIVFYIAIAVICTVMMIANYRSISTFVFVSCGVMAILSFLFVFFQLRARRFNIFFSVFYCCYALMLSAGFILTSGSQDFSLMWLMIFPYVAWLLFNEVTALFFSVSLLGITLILLFFPFDEEFFRFSYPLYFKNNFIAIMCFVTLSALLSHLMLMKTRQRLLVITEKLKKQAYEDPLTGIGNRNDFVRSMENRNFRSDTVYYAVVDIDHFKSVNDTWGHAAGDEVLMKVSGILRSSIRDDDQVFRWGGEEFLIVIQNMPAVHFSEYLDRIRKNVEQMRYVLEEGAAIQVTVSIGGAFGRMGERSGECIGRADACLYKAKQSGRNKVVIHEMTEDSSDIRPE